MSHNDIRALYGRCARLFAEFSQALTARQELYWRQITETALLDEFACFNIWAGNNGLSDAVDQPANASLSSALHESAAIVRTLVDLEVSLQAGTLGYPIPVHHQLVSLTGKIGIAIVSGARPPADELFDESNLGPLSDLSLEDKDEGYNPDDNAGPENHTSSTELQELFRAIVDSTTSLLRLSAIAHSAAAAAPRQESEEEFPSEQLQREDAIGHNQVLDNYPFVRSKPWLVARLCHASALRRQ